MLTIKLAIRSIGNLEFIKNKEVQYSYAFRLAYVCHNELSNKAFVEYLKQRFNLTDIEVRSLVNEVKSFIKREEASKTKRKDQLKDLEERLIKTTNSHKRFKISNRIALLKSSLNSKCVFGGRELLSELTRECNKEERNEVKIEELRNEFHRKRIIPFFIMGEGNQGGNRFFDFSKLSEGILIYKPKKGISIKIDFRVQKKFIGELTRLQEMATAKQIAVSVRISEDYLYLTFNEEELNGYALDLHARNKAVKEIKQMNLSEDFKEVLIKNEYAKFYREQREHMLEGKIEKRCISIDMNPTNIGYSIVDLKEDSTVKVIEAGIMDLSKLCFKINQSSESKESKYLNNKRKYELTIILKQLFNKANHYKCSKFVIEGLELKQTESFNKETNRKIKNLWCRSLITNIVKRNCSIFGIEFIEVNPCYSSCIGNIKYPYADAANAAIEIGRRGLTKYINGTFYPHITQEDIHTLESKFGYVVECSTKCGWKELYKSLTEQFDRVQFAQRLRTKVCESKVP